MIRRVIRIGDSLAITLPKKWVKSNEVEAGDFVFIPQLEKIKQGDLK